MAIIATAGESRTFTPAPEGPNQAVCVDVIDLGIVEVNWQGKQKQQHKIDVVWQLGERRDDGKRFLVYKRYTLSLSEKATLRHDLESWRGRPFTEQELKGFDVEVLKGVNCLLNLQHKKSQDGTRTYANVVAVMPLVKGMPKLVAEDYQRRTEQAEPEMPAESHEPVELDSIPF